MEIAILQIWVFSFPPGQQLLNSDRGPCEVLLRKRRGTMSTQLFRGPPLLTAFLLSHLGNHSTCLMGIILFLCFSVKCISVFCLQEFHKCCIIYLISYILSYCLKHHPTHFFTPLPRCIQHISLAHFQRDFHCPRLYPLPFINTLLALLIRTELLVAFPCTPHQGVCGPIASLGSPH